MTLAVADELENVRAYRALYKEWSCPVRYLGYSPPPNSGGRERARATCTLYFIASDPYLKIGLAADVQRRLLEFQGGNPHPIRLAAYRTIPNCLARQVEKRMHQHFADRSIGREWFRDLDAKEAVAASKKHIADANTAVHRWIVAGYFGRPDQ